MGNSERGGLDAESEEALLGRIAHSGAGAWDLFLDAFSPKIFRVVCLFADSYDDRMDLFLHACARLREDDMRRVRAFRHRPDAPCRFSTYLSVVVKNIALDKMRSRNGRFRPFRIIDAMDEVDQLLFQYHLREGLELEEARCMLKGRHGIRMTEPEIAERAGRVAGSLSSNQRWRLLAHLSQRRSPLPLDTVAGTAADSDPEKPLRHEEAEDALNDAFRTLEPRQRLALTLRYRDGLPSRQVADFMRVTRAEADRLAVAGLARVRKAMRHRGVGRPDIDLMRLALPWSRIEEVRE